jgi:hypothetical protein
MDEDDNSFPMDFYVEDPSPRPWKFRPEGYLAVILSLVMTSSSTRASRSSRISRSIRHVGTSPTR